MNKILVRRKKIMWIILSVIGILVVLMAGSMVLQNQKPQIALGLENGKLREVPIKPNAVSTQTNQADKKIEPLLLKASVKQSKEAMISALKTYGGIEIKQETENYIYAIATTDKMKFHDDIEIYFDETNKVIQYRSASRVGYSDMGLNKARYEKISQLYNK